ncbi:MAG: AAA family ATPase [Rhodospirillales bacterium]|nr:AAA family ATPase [Alphaproteobacteria bacterium]MCB9986185.1 AAA family ATPase [Rhodospirillales bacterium]USO07258.1 MAG: AAA family ATPase [Rhodospirillales bacterium]
MTTQKDTPRRSALNTMLPTASVHVFSAEEHTQDIIASLEGDWRFGRVTLEVKGGGIDEAIALYAESPSPSVIILQTDDTGDSFRGRLEKLAGQCAEGTRALVIGPVNDVQLYRQLTALGISDYLVHPVSLFDMAEAISGTLLEMLGASDSRLIAVIGAKGGVGTTNVAHMAAQIAAETLGQKTILLDAAAGHSTLWAQFGFSPNGTLVEAAKAAIDRDHDTLSRILMAVSENLTFMNTGAEPLLVNGSQQKLFEMLLERMLAQYPVVIADLSSTSPAIQSHVISRANGVFVVTTPTVNALSVSRTLIREILTMRGQETGSLHMIVNRRGEMPSYEVSDKEISSAVGFDVAVNMPYTPKLFLKAESDGKRPGDLPEGAKLQAVLEPIVAEYLGVSSEDHAESENGGGGFLPGLLKKFSS